MYTLKRKRAELRFARHSCLALHTLCSLRLKDHDKQKTTALGPHVMDLQQWLLKLLGKPYRLMGEINQSIHHPRL